MAQIAWTPQALDDLEAICLFIARDDPRVAEVFARRAFQAVERLADFPQSGRVVPEFGLEEVREVFLQSYRIIHRVKEGEVEILTVHHGAQLLDDLDL